MAQSVERRIGSAEVTGPIPVSSFSEIEQKARKYKVYVLQTVDKVGAGA